jgi:hypothetical protein
MSRIISISQGSRRGLSGRKFALVIGVLLSIVYINFFGFKAYFEIELGTHSDRPTDFKVYWAMTDGEYVRSQSKRIRIGSGFHHIKVYLGNLSDIRKIRIDPLEYAGQVDIRRVAISQYGYQPVEIGPQQFSQLKPLNEIESLEVQAEQLAVVTNGVDGNLELRLQPVKLDQQVWIHWFNVVLIIAGCLIISATTASLQREHKYVIICLGIALILATVMASITSVYVHPDEHVHFEAIKYYGNHVLPPALDSPEISSSFSQYGKSRLSTYEIYYPLSGYFTRILEPLRTLPEINARVFGLLLFAAILIFASMRPKFRYFALPMIVSPQIWYLYSYSNSDGFALALSIFAGYQFAVSGSALNRFLDEAKPANYVFSLLGFGLLAGALLLSKQTFYFFLLFLVLYTAWRAFNGYYKNPKQVWMRLAAIGVIAVSMYGIRYGLDFAANGPDPGAKFQEYIELTAKEEFNPKTPLEDQHIYLNLKQRGTDLDALLKPLKWGSITFDTAFGAYGYTQYFAPDRYFEFVKILILLIGATIVFFTLTRGTPSSQLLILLAASSAGLLVLASLWMSWTVNFQAQGRYMAPIVPMFSIVYYHVQKYLNNTIFTTLVLFMFALSVYSFIFYGLGFLVNTR